MARVTFFLLRAYCFFAIIHRTQLYCANSVQSQTNQRSSLISCVYNLAQQKKAQQNNAALHKKAGSIAYVVDTYVITQEKKRFAHVTSLLKKIRERESDKVLAAQVKAKFDTEKLSSNRKSSMLKRLSAPKRRT